MSYIYGPPINTRIVARHSIGNGHHALGSTAGRDNSLNHEHPFYRIDPTPVSPALDVTDAGANSDHSHSKRRRRRTELFVDTFNANAVAHGSHAATSYLNNPFDPHTGQDNRMITTVRLPLPSNHARLPQLQFTEPPYDHRDASVRSPSVYFQHAGYPEIGVRVGTAVNCKSLDLVTGRMKVFHGGYSEITIRIAWPGYSSEPFQRRIDTQNGGITRENLLKALANVVLAFAGDIRKLNIPVQRGFERWAVGMHPNGRKGLTVLGACITSLHHRGGPNWQPEIWIPNDMM